MNKRNTVLAFVGAFVVVLALAAGLGLLHSDLTELQTQNKAQATQIHSLTQELDGVQGSVNGLVGAKGDTGDLDKIRAANVALVKRVATLEGRMRTVCVDKAVSNQRSTLYGEASASQGDTYAYYQNLQDIITAACGPEPTQE